MTIEINIKVINITGGEGAAKGRINNFFSSIKRQVGRPGSINNFECTIQEQVFTGEPESQSQSKKPRQGKKGK